MVARLFYIFALSAINQSSDGNGTKNWIRFRPDCQSVSSDSWCRLWAFAKWLDTTYTLADFEQMLFESVYEEAQEDVGYWNE